MREAERGLLLLRCRLGEAVHPLSQREYTQLRAVLEGARGEGDDSEVSPELLRDLGFEREMAERIAGLLNRPQQPKRYLEAQPDISVLTRISPDFPRRLRSLGQECPPALFCKGDLSLLQRPCIALVGSRLLFERGGRFAQRIGALAAKEGYVLVSGNAAGADRMAQEACLRSGGSVISVVPDALQNCPLRERQLFLCDEGYDCTFTASRALRRNHLIHALAEKVFVAQCPKPSGGTWSGAEDNLNRGLSPVYVLDDGSDGARALWELGAVLVKDDVASLREQRPSQLSIFD